MLEASYIILSIIIAGLIIYGYSYGAKNSSLSIEIQQKKIRSLVLMLIGWFIYLGILSKTEFLYDTSLPPRFVIFLFIPLTLICVRFYLKKKDSEILANIPMHWLIAFQTFRIAVEVILLFTFLKGIIPISATFEGYNFDILWGIMAPIVTYLTYKNLNKTILKIWNIAGMLMVLFVAFIIGSSNYFPEIWGSSTSLVSVEFFTLPYLLIAGFLAPAAIFIHVVTLTKLRK